MKKTFKKLMAALLAVALLCAMAVPAMAEGNNFQISAPNNGHTYKIYQIFTGTPSTDSDGNKVLSDIKWGLNASGEGHATGASVDSSILTTLAGTSGETDILNLVKTYVDLNDTAAFTATHSSPATVPAGYYLIKDDESVTLNNGDSYSLYLVEVINADVTITPKTDAPSVEKKVKENVKVSDATYGAGYNDTADYNIGDMVPFKLIGKVPSMEHYTTYEYIFHDTLATAFDAPNASDIHVSLADSKDSDGAAIDASSYTVSATGHNITITFTNLKNVSDIAAGKYIIVTYSAKLNNSASIGTAAPGNTNEVYLEYSNNPNTSSKGETIHDKVIVFTYKLDVTKIDAKNHDIKLKDAEFKLLNSDKTKAASVVDGKFAGWVEESSGTILKSDNNGFFSVTGLDDGTYYLKEIKAPEGYNTLTSPVKVVISANTNNGQNRSGETTDLTTINISVNDADPTNGNVANGTVSIEVENNAGATLPSTGGMGTTLFYVIGGGLMVAAVVLLVTKKRMENK